jgi:hypothetical protein
VFGISDENGDITDESAVTLTSNPSIAIFSKVDETTTVVIVINIDILIDRNILHNSPSTITTKPSHQPTKPTKSSMMAASLSIFVFVPLMLQDCAS